MADDLILIVDFPHLLRRYYRGMGDSGTSSVAYQLDETRLLNTEPVRGILNWFIKISRNGKIPMIVCMDNISSSRKRYFEEKNLDFSLGNYLASDMQLVQDAVKMALESSDMLVLQQNNYTSSDLVVSCVQDLLSKDGFTSRIGIISGDLDLVQCVNDRVSLYRYPAKLESAEPGHLLIPSYVEITPNNYQKVLADSSFQKSIDKPYGSYLFIKLVRGDKRFDLPILPSWRGKTELLRSCVEQLTEEGKMPLFSYHSPIKKYHHLPSGQFHDKLPQNAVLKDWRLHFNYDDLFDGFRSSLSDCGCSSEQIDDIIERYEGINLNGAILSVSDWQKRKPYVADTNRTNLLDVDELEDMASVWNIKLFRRRF